MTTGLLFVTAPEADHKAINLLLHHLRDWESSDGEDQFRLVATKNAYNLEPPESPSGVDTFLSTTSPSLDSTFENAWAGSSLKDVEDFCLDIVRNDVKGNIGASLFVLIDSLGFQARDAVLAERAFGEKEGGLGMLDIFVKTRVPWGELMNAWCNLSLGASEFAEMGERREEGGEWYDFHTGYVCDLDEEADLRKDRAFQRLKDGGRV
jgi:hypothetical protein